LARWLLKTEPSEYSFDQLVKDKKTVWSGVTNATALIHLRSMSKGDEAIIYHTGNERAAVGLATIASGPYPDPSAENEKLVVVDLKAGKRLASPVPLATIKADKSFAGWDLLRIGRLSVVPVPDAMWDRLMTLSRGDS
jgi:predicted RNA-binding protein with PUA-like domain